MKYDVKKYPLISNAEIADGIFDMRVEYDSNALPVKCGQFAHVYVPSKPCADRFPCAMLKTAFLGLCIRSRARAQRLCHK